MTAHQLRELFLSNEICEKKMSSRKRSYTKIDVVEDNADSSYKVCRVCFTTFCLLNKIT